MNILEKIKQEKLEKLNDSLKKSNIRAHEINEEISDLEDEFEGVKEDIQQYNQEIKRLEESIPPGTDEFAIRFIQASRFCCDTSREVLQDIKIGTNSLLAIDGCRGIEIFCDIPEQLQGTRIHNSVRCNFVENISKLAEPYPNIDTIFDYNSEKYPRKYTLKASEWIDIILAKGIPIDREPVKLYAGRGAIKFTFDDIRIGINKYYVADLFALFNENEEITLHWSGDPLTALVFTTDTITGLILPVILREE